MSRRHLLESADLLACLAESLASDALDSLSPAIAQVRVEAEALVPRTVGVIGSVGCGKSTWISALCGLNGLLPSRYGTYTVTTCPTVIRGGPAYRCSIRLGSNEDIHRLLLAPDARVDRAQMVLQTALRLLLLEDGTECEALQELRARAGDDGMMHFECDGPEQLSQYLRFFILTRLASDQAPPSLETVRDTRFWPIIQEIIVEVGDNRLPPHVQIVDTPGLGDVNAYRFPRTQYWLGRCQEMWLLCGETRNDKMEQLLLDNADLLLHVPRVHLLKTKAEPVLSAMGQPSEPDQEEQRQEYYEDLGEIIQATILRDRQTPIDIRFSAHLLTDFTQSPTLPNDQETLRLLSTEFGEQARAIEQRIQELYDCIKRGGMSEEEVERARALSRLVRVQSHRIRQILHRPPDGTKLNEWANQLSNLKYQVRQKICDMEGRPYASSAQKEGSAGVAFPSYKTCSKWIHFTREFERRFFQPIVEEITRIFAHLRKETHHVYPLLQQTSDAMFRSITTEFHSWVASSMVPNMDTFYLAQNLEKIFREVLRQTEAKVIECLRPMQAQVSQLHQTSRAFDPTLLPRRFANLTMENCFALWSVRCRALEPIADPGDLSLPVRARDALLGADPSLRSEELFQPDQDDNLLGNLSFLARAVCNLVTLHALVLQEDGSYRAWELTSGKADAPVVRLVMQAAPSEPISRLSRSKFRYIVTPVQEDIEPDIPEEEEEEDPEIGQVVQGSLFARVPRYLSSTDLGAQIRAVLPAELPCRVEAYRNLKAGKGFRIYFESEDAAVQALHILRSRVRYFRALHNFKSTRFSVFQEVPQPERQEEQEDE